MDQPTNIRVHAWRDHQHFGHKTLVLAFFSHGGPGEKSYEGRLEFEERHHGDRLTDCVLIDDSAGQALMDQLWECGLRPSEGAGSAGAMLACQAHLANLQAINGQLLGLLRAYVPQPDQTDAEDGD